jgi:hypothetical protein
MTFDLMRLGWPNLVAVVALALLPVVSLTTLSEPGGAAANSRQVVAFCPEPADGPMLATLLSETVVE